MNKKLIKILVCSACGLGIASSIPFMTTSCGSSDSPKPFVEVDLPYEDDANCVLNITSGNFGLRLDGFKEGFDIKNYPTANTLVIPKRVVQISGYAFSTSGSGVSEIPKQITCIRFEKDLQYYENDLDTTGFGYGNTSITMIDFGTTYIKYSGYAYKGWSKLNTIKFDSNAELPGVRRSPASSNFEGVSATGQIIVYGDGDKTAQQFKEALISITKEKDEDPSVFDGWTAKSTYSF